MEETVAEIAYVRHLLPVLHGFFSRDVNAPFGFLLTPDMSVFVSGVTEHEQI